MKIIFIHGMNQQNYTADSLKAHWINIFRKGIEESGLNVDIEKLDIVMPFYGDLITKHQLSNNLNLDNFLPQSLFNFHANAQAANKPEVQSAIPCITPLPLFNPQHNVSLYTRLYLASQFAKDMALKEFVTVLNNFPKLQESLIHKFLIETYMYLDCPEFMLEVNQRVLQCLVPHEQYIIVAHSLGTVIAFNLLQQLNPNICIQRFITLGSPLAFRMVQAKIVQPIIYPKSLHGDWYNFYSDDDFLTAFPLCEAPFNFKPHIKNKKISTFINMPHKIIGYLQHPAVIQCILEHTIQQHDAKKVLGF